MSRAIQATILSSHPLVIFTWISEENSNSTLSVLAKPLENVDVTFIIQPGWSLESESFARDFIPFIQGHQRTYRRHHCCVVVNTKKERLILKKAGIDAFFFHHNSLVDPSLFSIEKSEIKEFSAVYNAAIADFKRHYLCGALKSLALVYYSHDRADLANDPLLQSLKKTLPMARFLNEELADPPHSHISPAQVNLILNRSKVGLCLSAVEGGMYASIEYLLAGLPIVSTPSIGGRDFFFDSDFVEIAEPHASAIAEAVERVSRRAPPADIIRSRTIDRQKAQIDSFIAYLDKIIRKKGGAGYDRAQWDAVYCHKLHRWETVETVLERVSSAPQPVSRPRSRMRWIRDRVSVRVRNLIG